FAGEILDVQGPRGGYNLAWAWASGIVAGLAGRGPGGNAGVSPTSRRSSA
ncbi:MAG TPA: NAD(P)/FAD-dependent oxidoreductase, partial [Candidatus Aminicenantes bacterium]|nr:NAD(P)/FAD-dependent oxidoreductase [Candidatus Aminicenantes bacterium]